MGQVYVAVYRVERPGRRGHPRRLCAAPAGRRAAALTPDRLTLFVTGLNLPALVALCAQSPDAWVRDDAARLRRLALAGQVVYQGVMRGLPVALGDPYFRLDLARAAAKAGLDLFPPARWG